MHVEGEVLYAAGINMSITVHRDARILHKVRKCTQLSKGLVVQTVQTLKETTRTRSSVRGTGERARDKASINTPD